MCSNAFVISDIPTNTKIPSCFVMILCLLCQVVVALCFPQGWWFLSRNYFHTTGYSVWLGAAGTCWLAIIFDIVVTWVFTDLESLCIRMTKDCLFSLLPRSTRLPSLKSTDPSFELRTICHCTFEPHLHHLLYIIPLFPLLQWGHSSQLTC